jgi:hypothetical protein
MMALLLPSGRLMASVVSVDLGAADRASGLSNTQRENATDGENDACSSGPAGETRDGRKNRGTADNDFADLYLYFLVSDPTVKSTHRLRISASLYDDPAFGTSPANVRLHYTNQASTGPPDLPNTFASHPDVLKLTGTGQWVRHTWKLSDAGFRTFMQGTSDFRFDLGTSRVCFDRVDVATDPPIAEPKEHFVAAHYYPWYTPGRWNYAECVAGALRLELVPPQPPLLGRYDSSSPSVVDKHLRWCAEYGVNVLILEFIQPGSREDQICRQVILPHRRSGDVRFTVLYDWAIRFQNGFDVTSARIGTARADFAHLAREYFPHPSFFKVRGELPLVMIYVTRALTGNVSGLIGAIREACAIEGFEVFLVGDEFFFPQAPNAQKIARWDGIFGYDVYAGRGGYWGENGTLNLFRQRTDEYKQVAEASGVKFFPSCAPGFNDRAIRRTCANNPAFPRQLSSSGDPTSLFRAVFKDLALSRVNGEVPLVCVTSFNEWHEDTEIEPTLGSGSTTADTSSSGMAYTQGFPHHNHGLSYLELIRDATLAVTGKVIGPDAQSTAQGPFPGATVEVLEGERVLLTRTSFSTGAYTVPRLLLQSGQNYRLRVSAPGIRPVLSDFFQLLANKARTEFDVEIGAVSPKVSRGDCNSDKGEDLSDSISLLSFLFSGGPKPHCLEACNLNGDSSADISDAVYLLGHLFLGGPPAGNPSFPACGPVSGARDCAEGNCS